MGESRAQAAKAGVSGMWVLLGRKHRTCGGRRGVERHVKEAEGRSPQEPTLKSEREIGPRKGPSSAVLRISGRGLRWAMRNPPEPWRCVVGRGQMARTKSEWALGRGDMSGLLRINSWKSRAGHSALEIGAA